MYARPCCSQNHHQCNTGQHPCIENVPWNWHPFVQGVWVLKINIVNEEHAVERLDQVDNLLGQISGCLKLQGSHIPVYKLSSAPQFQRNLAHMFSARHYYWMLKAICLRNTNLPKPSYRSNPSSLGGKTSIRRTGAAWRHYPTCKVPYELSDFEH